MSKVIVWLVTLLIIAGGAFLLFGSGGNQVEAPEVSEEVDVVEHTGVLSDVTEGEVRGINTGGEATGTVTTSFVNGVYALEGRFDNLPDPVESDFYEGWVVRRGEDMSVISTGALEKVGDYYSNNFTSDQDLTDHDFYVLTLEPDDGDPAPADHILEGDIN